MPNVDPSRPRAVLVAVQEHGVTDADLDASLQELKRLCDTMGLTVVGRVTQKRGGVGAVAVLGKGKLKELAAWTGGTGEIPKGPAKPLTKKQKKDALAAEEEGEGADDLADEPDDEDEPFEVAPPKDRATMVVVDHELSPAQLKNLEKACGVEVLDRTGVILEIFHRHASSREARAQVEIARLQYLAPRLRESAAPSERQGARGASESDLELDRRKIRDRIAELKQELTVIQSAQSTRRARRKDAHRVALVGYTNAGKSSMMRALTQSEIYVADKLFATLDTTVRALWPETVPKILVSDTVGFIRKLPHDLVASFRSTLDEALEASLLLYMVDAADPGFREQLAVTREVLTEIGAGDVPSMLVLNKADKLDDAAKAALREEYPDALIVSAKDPAGVRVVREAILGTFERDMSEGDLVVPYDRSSLIGEVHGRARVLAESYEEDGVHYRIRASSAVIDRLRQLVAEPA